MDGQILRIVFKDGQIVDIDVVEFGKDEAGAIIDRLALKHGGVDRIRSMPSYHIAVLE